MLESISDYSWKAATSFGGFVGGCVAVVAVSPTIIYMKFFAGPVTTLIVAGTGTSFVRPAYAAGEQLGRTATFLALNTAGQGLTFLYNKVTSVAQKVTSVAEQKKDDSAARKALMQALREKYANANTAIEAKPRLG